MIRILGRKILMQKGEAGTFRVMLHDFKGNEIPLSKNDKFILRARHTMETDDKFRKVSTPLELNIKDNLELYQVIQFKSTDTRRLLAGDYQYELIFERNGNQFTVIPPSIFTLEDSMSSIFPEDDLVLLGNEYEDDDDEEDTLLIFEDNTEDEVVIFEEEDDTLECQYSIIISTPLIGNLDAVAYKRLFNKGAEDDDDLIIINMR